MAFNILFSIIIYTKDTYSIQKNGLLNISEFFHCDSSYDKLIEYKLNKMQLQNTITNSRLGVGFFKIIYFITW